jgi:putative transport protein
MAPNGYSREVVRNNITTAYAITYIFGLVGLIVIIRMLPKLLKINLVEEALILKEKEEGSKKRPLFSPSDLVVRAFKVESQELTGITLDNLYDRANLNITIQKIIRDGEIIDPKSDTMLIQGDLVSVIGIMDDKAIETFEKKTLGPLVRNRDLLHFEPETARISVTKKEMRGTKLGDLRIPLTYASFVSKVSRLGVPIEVTENTVLELGDVLDVSGPSKGLDMLGLKLGHVEYEVEQTDLQTFSWSIVIGILLGTITLSVAGITIGLGSAAGLLGIGLLVGYLRSVFPVFGRVPAGAQWIFNELGLLLFMAGVGLRGGDGLIATLQSSGLELLFSGVLVTTIPLFIAYFLGRRVLKMNPLILLGAVIGAMTSGGALSVLNEESKSSIASVGYTGAYAFANILLTLAGAFIMMM